MVTRFIAEIANAHEGDGARLMETVAAAVECNIPAVKFQVFQACDLYAEDHEHYALFDGLAFEFDVWRRIFDDLRSHDTEIYCDVFSTETARFCADNGIECIKIHASDAFNRPLLEQVAALGFAEIIVGVGGLYGFEIADLVGIISRRHEGNIVLMHGQQSYPTTREGNNIEKISWLADHFGDICEIGYADHSLGASGDATDLTRIAMASGATCFEKHVSLDVAAKGIDHESSIDLPGFNKFCKKLAHRKEVAAPSRFLLGPAELNYRRNVVKRPRFDPGTAGIVYLRGDDAGAAVPRGLNPDDITADDLAADLANGGVYRNILAVIVVRLESQRLPRKAFARLGTTTVLGTLIDNIRKSTYFDDLVIATTHAGRDDEIKEFCRANGVKVHRGSVENVAQRMSEAIDHCEQVTGRPVTHIARMTGDNPFLIQDVHQPITDILRTADFDYIRVSPVIPGLNAEYFNAPFFRTLTNAMVELDYSEYITYFVNNHRDEILMREITVEGIEDVAGRYTIDWPEDLAFCEKFIAFMAERTIAVPTIEAILEFEKSVTPAEIFKARQKRPDDVQYRLRWGNAIGSVTRKEQS